VRDGKTEEPAEPGLVALAQEVVDSRCDWKLRVDHVALEIRKCPKELREEAVEQFAKDMANQVDPPDNPLAYFRKYMQNADRYSSKNSGKKINGGARGYVRPGRGDNEGASSDLPPPKPYDAANDPDRLPDVHYKPKPSIIRPKWDPEKKEIVGDA
jgi:hypothetical protein